jgi:hypothetical protein
LVLIILRLTKRQSAIMKLNINLSTVLVGFLGSASGLLTRDIDSPLAPRQSRPTSYPANTFDQIVRQNFQQYMPNI